MSSGNLLINSKFAYCLTKNELFVDYVVSIQRRWKMSAIFESFTKADFIYQKSTSGTLSSNNFN